MPVAKFRELRAKGENVMKMLAIGFTIGLLAGVAGSIWSNFVQLDELSKEIDEIHARFEEIPTRAELDAQVQRIRADVSQNRLGEQELKRTVMNAVHGCHVVGYSNADISRIECPLF